MAASGENTGRAGDEEMVRCSVVQQFANTLQGLPYTSSRSRHSMMHRNIQIVASEHLTASMVYC